MNISGKGPPATGEKISIAKAMSLNPNAAEFVPFALRSPSGSTSSSDVSKLANSTTSLGKPVLDRSESSVSNNSDDEAHQYWRHQLPDDITPDFKVMGEDDSHGNSGLSFSSLSIADASEAPRFSTSAGSGFMWNDLHEISSSRINGTSSGEKMRHHIMSFSEDASSTSFHLPAKPWDKQSLNNDHLFASVTEGSPYGGNSGNSFFADMINEDPFLETDLNPLEFLASQFPGLAAESLADVYYANGGDFNLTMEMLTQLELQVDVRLHQDLNPKALHAPNLSSLDFPALSVADNLNSMPKYNGDDLRQNVNPYRSSENESTLLFKSGSSIPSFKSASSTHSRGAIDFASAVRKMASPDASPWKYDRNGFADATVGSGRKLSVLASSYHGGQSRGVYGDRLQSRGSTRAAPVWLETGEVVESMYSEMREEARDHARLRNTYFEQARQAYLVGNKALAKELSMKGQVHNVQMKAAHGKAQESIYPLRNPVGPEMQGNGRGQERIIDLHGLHVTEAIHVLKRELSVLRNAARSADQRVQVYICVGTGHHSKGSRTPARLPISVQRYLLEEGLDYSEPQPGLLRIVI